MKQLTGNEVRQLFLNYFKSKGHLIEPSHSLIPNDDPTLLWINAGVAAIKSYFDGSSIPENPRITNAQKSLRTNDIENVGKTARHHTFFEMLGNFSIGDYFKLEAIDFAWEFLTDEAWLGFDKDKLYITVHDQDTEAYDYWVNVKKIEPDHMLKTAGNFWEIGEGPCGPDSEIFYDRGEQYDKEGLGTKLFYEELENDRYVEIWNLVFSQYNSKEGVERSDYEELPQKNIDTGMGLERLVSIIQNGETNYDTDFFLPIIHEVEKLANKPYVEEKMAYRVIADHIRTVTFCLGDGAVFDNVGRGYVLRRILRRAVRFGKKLGIENAFMYELVSVVSDIMKDYYVELPSKVALIEKLVKREEEAFHKTLNHGEKLLVDILKSSNAMVSGKDAFKLYDTYGFPYELTEEIAQEYNQTVDYEGFKEELKIQQERSRNSREDVNSMSSQKIDLIQFVEPSEFIYEPEQIEATVIGLFVDGVQVDTLENDGEIILDKSTFYAQMGGQCYDSGTIVSNDTVMEVKQVIQAPNKQHLHFVSMNKGKVKVGDQVTLHVDVMKRSKITANHTATHILQKALKVVLGDHISQAGSDVDEQRLRFDFTHYEKISTDLLQEVEKEVNRQIFSLQDVVVQSMSKEEAVEKGAMALFGEKYGDVVRVVSVGDYSVELCGGCHVVNSGNIGLFKIVSEESVGSGVRRIEAITGEAAYLHTCNEQDKINQIGRILKTTNLNDVVGKVEQIQHDLADTKKQLDVVEMKLNQMNAGNLLDQVVQINDINVLFVEEKLESSKAKQMAFDVRDKLNSGVVVMTSVFEDKVSYYVAVTNDVMSTGVKAGDVVRKINELVDGRGGGKPDFAQGGCSKVEDIVLIKNNLKNIL